MATKVTGPDSTTPDIPPADNVHYRDTGGTMVVPIGPDQLDGPRIAARHATYPNAQAEMAAVRAIDEAAFDRVRTMEGYILDRATRDLAAMTDNDPERGTIANADQITSDLYAIVTELERGASASDLAARFKALQNRAMQEALPRVARAQRTIAWHMPRVEDPYGTTQNSIAKMPYSSYRPLDPSRYAR